MKKQIVNDFLLGIGIAFTIAVLILSLIMTFTSADSMVPVSLIVQAFVLSILCSLINLVYRLEYMTFFKQSIIGYFLTTTIIIVCGFIFNWYGSGNNNFQRISLIFEFFIICSLFYLVTWIIIWRIRKANEKDLNYRLNEFKKKQ